MMKKQLSLVSYILIAILLTGNSQAQNINPSFNSGGGFNGNATKAFFHSGSNQILVSGTFSDYNGTTANNAIAISPSTGTASNNYFLPNAVNGQIYDFCDASLIADPPFFSVLVVGNFTNVNGTGSTNIAFVRNNNTVNPAIFTPQSINGEVRAIVAIPNPINRYCIAGNFTMYSGQTRNRIALINPNGSIHTGFNPNGGANNTIMALGVTPANDGIIAGGAFTMFDGNTVNRLVKLNMVGGIDNVFLANNGTGANGAITTIKVDNASGKIYIGGYFTTFNGVPRNGIARLHPNGTLDATFNPGTGVSGGVETMTFIGPNLVIGGTFTTYNGVYRRNIAVLDSATANLNLSIHPGSGTDGTVSSAINVFSQLLIVGNFNQYNCTNQRKISNLQMSAASPSPLLNVPSVPSSICAGSSFSLAYSASGYCDPNNSFIAELSDASGSFTTPVVIGTLANTTGSGNIPVTISAGTPNGNAYRIRVISTAPSITSGAVGPIQINQTAIVSAGTGITVCANNPTINLNGSVLNASGGSWTTSGTGSFANANAVVTTYTPSAADIAGGSVSFTLTSTGNGACAAIQDNFIANIGPAPTANAGADQTHCANVSTVNLSGAVTIATGGSWTTSGSGTFANANAVVTTYTPSAADRASGMVNLRLVTTGNGTCAAVADTVRITFQPAPTANGGGNLTICSNTNSIPLTAGFSNATGIVWSTSGSGTFNPNNTSVSSNYVLSAADQASPNFTLTLTTTGNGVCPAAIYSKGITVNTATNITQESTNQTICEGSNTSFSIVAVGNSNVSRWQVSISGGTFNDIGAGAPYTGIASNTLNLTNPPLSFSGNRYRCIVTGSCTADTSLPVVLTINPSQILSASITASPGNVICKNDQVSFTANVVNGGSDPSYQWRVNGNAVGSNSPTLSGNKTKNGDQIICIVTSSLSGCVTNSPAGSNTITMTVNPLPSVYAGKKQEICEDSIAFFAANTPGPGETGLWSVASGNASISNVNSPFSSVTIHTDGEHVFNWKITNLSTGCSADSSTKIFKCLLPKVIAYNVISPGSDNRHDFLEFENLEVYTNNQVIIYNRWGDIVFETKNYDNHENVFKGVSNVNGEKELPDGVYYYLITNLEDKSEKGFLMLRR